MQFLSNGRFVYLPQRQRTRSVFLRAWEPGGFCGALGADAA